MQEAEAYNVFRRKQNSSLCCAILQGLPVPSFVQGETWEFGGTVSGSDTMPFGFNLRAAQEAMRLIGYYLFQDFSRSHAATKVSTHARPATLASLKVA